MALSPGAGSSFALGGVAVASTAPTDGDFLKYNTTTVRWEPSKVARGGLTIASGQVLTSAAGGFLVLRSPAGTGVTIQTSGANERVRVGADGGVVIGSVTALGAAGLGLANALGVSGRNAAGNAWRNIATLTASDRVQLGEAGIPVTIPDGAAGTPALAFTSAPTYGLYLNGGSLVAISIAGALCFQVGASAIAYTSTLIAAQVQGGAVSGSGAGNPLVFLGGGTTQAVGIHAAQNSSNYTGTSGTQEHVRASATFAPTSGNAKFVGLRVAPTINQTGGANGDYTALEVDATETAAGGTNKRLLDLRVAATSRLSVDNGGRIRNHNASNEAAGATAGGGAALPATVAGFYLFTDAAGNTRKIPFYAN